MSFIQATTRAGKSIILEQYFAPRHGIKGVPVNSPTEDLSEAHEKANLRRSIRELTIKLNANFEGGDYYITLTYEKDKAPSSPDDAKKDRADFLRRLRRLYRKADLNFKYVITTEYGKRGALHHHLVINKGVDTSLLRRAWKKGNLKIVLLEDSGEYSRLASYFLKNRKYWKEHDGSGRQWTGSRNLVRPKTYKKIIRMDTYYDKPKPRKGFYIAPYTEAEGFTKDGYPYRSCIFVEAGLSP